MRPLEGEAFLDSAMTRMLGLGQSRLGDGEGLALGGDDLFQDVRQHGWPPQER